MKSTGEGQRVIIPVALVFFLHLLFCHGHGGAVDVSAAVGRTCGGRGVGECGLRNRVGVEMEAAGVDRRELQQSQETKYITYRSLNRDNVPCTSPGVSYYSCDALPNGNTHTRGCFTIAHCRNGYH